MSTAIVAAAAEQPAYRRWLPVAIMWLALITVPAWFPLMGGYTALAANVLVFGLAAMGLNILLGFTGVLSFGHAAYFGLGAYGTGLMLKYVAPSTPLAMLAGILLGGLGGTLFGLLIVRRRGVYFAMCTIAFGQIFYYIAYKWNDFTGGFDGLRGFHREPIGLGALSFDITDGTRFYYFTVVVFTLAVALMSFLLRSPFGRTLRAIRENERRARFLGIPVERHIWLSFSISCFFTALAGTLYALLNNFADPLALHYSLSGFFVIMAVLGGMRSFWGPLLGAVVFVVLRDFLSSALPTEWMAFLGAIFMLSVLFFPRGMLGMLKRRGVE
ncbi:MAG TPA: branched-chain amino acid ABC transporter permease [Bradyrhizobium sp.]|uniref:branched-chain amino acid ABC transporter permease n=1 Tax=Bradyrhizobium sp. TaxID=376 RepID=UPI002C3C4690|nr:branched-chain amino acid ABC transporter permease [Bradyrhizobium sp.]HLZ01360.1 branched-chain amino acid ABC transporter permease [Bradyrhizobium sp.]